MMMLDNMLAHLAGVKAHIIIFQWITDSSYTSYSIISGKISVAWKELTLSSFGVRGYDMTSRYGEKPLGPVVQKTISLTLG